VAPPIPPDAESVTADYGENLPQAATPKESFNELPPIGLSFWSSCNI